MYECVDVRGQFPPDRTWVKLILATSSSTYWAILLTPKYTDLSKFTHLKFWFNQAPNSLIMATCGWLLAKSNRTSVEWPSAVSCHRIRLGTPALAKVVASTDRGLAVKKKVQSAVPETRGSKGWQKALRSQWAGKRKAGLRSEVSASGVVCVSACSEELLTGAALTSREVPLCNSHFYLLPTTVPGTALDLAPKTWPGELKPLRVAGPGADCCLLCPLCAPFSFLEVGADKTL